MSSPEKLADDVAKISRQIAHVEDCRVLSLCVKDTGATGSQLITLHDACEPPIRAAVLSILHEQRAALIIELAEAAGFQAGDERLALPSETES